jgi:phospholipase A1/A2
MTNQIQGGFFMRLVLFCLLLSFSIFANAQSHVKKNTEAGVIKRKVKKALLTITTDKTSVLQKKIHDQRRALNNPLGILFYYPTYIMPYYYTGRPARGIYQGATPNNQKLKNADFKFQFSFQIPVWRQFVHFHHTHLSLYASYTQLSYWQFYAKSQYFRETNYEPQVFVTSNFLKNWLARFGIDHQSNGRGGSLERSWNRIFLTLNVSRNHWLLSVEPWVMILKRYSSDIDNPDIARYLGHEQIVIAYQFTSQVELSLLVRNIERFRYMSQQIACSLPLTKHINLFIQVFHGYGQSLIEYNHKTTSAGIGISLSNWL